MKQRTECVYLVLTHRNDQVLLDRMVRAILERSAGASVLVFHDARTHEPPIIAHPRVMVVPHRHRSDWGSWEIVEATMDALQLARSRFDPDMLVLVSGQDYPVGDLNAWEASFLSGGGGWTGTAWPITYQAAWGARPGKGERLLRRYTYRWYRMPGSRKLIGGGRTAKVTRKILGRTAVWLDPIFAVDHMWPGRGTHVGFRDWVSPLRKRVRCLYGSQWLAMDRARLDGVLDRHARDHRLRDAYAHSLIPDESYLQTILGSLVDIRQGPPISFYEWDETRSHPRILTLDDLQAIRSSGSPFCRKVDLATSSALLNALDAEWQSR